MGKRLILLYICLCMGIFTACGAVNDDIGNSDGYTGDGSADAGMVSDEDVNKVTVGDGTDDKICCRVVDADNGELLLAEMDGRAGDVYRLGTKDVKVITESGEALPDSGIEAGSLIEITFNGNIEETFPAQLSDVTEIKVMDMGGFDNLCSLYLDVLEDLWEVDSGLNSDITELGVDLSQTRLSPAEKSALAWRFGELHGLEIVQGTWQELVEQGYIDGENLYWENGCLFSITEKEMEGTYNLNVVKFSAEKWRSGLGAYTFVDCTSVQSALGKWGEYQIGWEAIA